MRVERFTHFNILMMCSYLSNRLIATVIMCSLLLQGCRSVFQVTSEEPVLKKSRKTSHDVQDTDQTSVLSVPYAARSDVPNSRLPVAIPPPTLPLGAIATVQVASPTHHLAVKPGTLSNWKQVPSTELEETDTKPAARPTLVFGAKEWSQYFGAVGMEPSLPPDIDEIMGSDCPFWTGKAVKDTHLLVLIPSKVDDKPFSLNLLEKLIQHPKDEGNPTKYRSYGDAIEKRFGTQSPRCSYWVLMTRDVLEGSRSKDYTAQEALVAAHVYHTGLLYELPGVLEAVTAILLHYVRNEERLYTDNPWTYTRCQELIAWGGSSYPAVVGGFSSGGLAVSAHNYNHSSHFGVAGLRKFKETDMKPAAGIPTQVAEFSSVSSLSSLHTLPLPVSDLIFGEKAWSQYFGEVGEAPPLPVHIVDTLNSACPFWPDRKVKDTHLLVLIPATVDGKPFSLNLLRKLVQSPQGGGYSTRYRVYDREVQEQFGTQPPGHSYWVLMTRDVLEGSRDETYTSQQALVAQHAGRTGLYYQLPGVLEAATVILSHYVRSGERLYSDNPCTYTRCRDMDIDRALGSGSFLTVGNFLSEGLSVSRDFSSNPHGTGQYRFGVTALRQF